MVKGAEFNRHQRFHYGHGRCDVFCVPALHDKTLIFYCLCIRLKKALTDSRTKSVEEFFLPDRVTSFPPAFRNACLAENTRNSVVNQLEIEEFHYCAKGFL